MSIRLSLSDIRCLKPALGRCWLPENSWLNSLTTTHSTAILSCWLMWQSYALDTRHEGGRGVIMLWKLRALLTFLPTRRASYCSRSLRNRSIYLLVRLLFPLQRSFDVSRVLAGNPWLCSSNSVPYNTRHKYHLHMCILELKCLS